MPQNHPLNDPDFHEQFRIFLRQNMEINRLFPEERLERLHTIAPYSASIPYPSRRIHLNDDASACIAVVAYVFDIGGGRAYILCRRFITENVGVDWHSLRNLVESGAVIYDNDRLRLRAQEEVAFVLRDFSALSELLSQYQIPTPETPKPGNPGCQFNARSPYILCAVNPSGPCNGCIHFKEAE